VFQDKTIYSKYYPNSKSLILQSSLRSKLSYLYKLSNLLCFLKQNNIVHGDLKLENVMLDVDENTPKVIDWGSWVKIRS